MTTHKLVSVLYRERKSMDNENKNMTAADALTTSDAESAAAQKEPPALVKKIGKMTYIVRVHFSTTSKETFTDKVNRLLRQEVRQMMENEAAGK